MMRISRYNDGTNESFNVRGPTKFYFNENTKGFICRIQLGDTKTFSNDTISISMSPSKSNAQLTKDYPLKNIVGANSPYASVDDFPTNYAIYFFNGDHSPEGYPFGAGWLFVVPVTEDYANNTMQIAYKWNPGSTKNPVVYRTKDGSTWQSWKPFINTDSFDNAVEMLFKYNCFEAIGYQNGITKTANGITYTRNNDNTWTLSGSNPDNRSFNNIFNNSSGGLPGCFIPGRSYKFIIPEIEESLTSILNRVFSIQYE